MVFLNAAPEVISPQSIWFKRLAAVAFLVCLSLLTSAYFDRGDSQKFTDLEKRGNLTKAQLGHLKDRFENAEFDSLRVGSIATDQLTIDTLEGRLQFLVSLGLSDLQAGGLLGQSGNLASLLANAQLSGASLPPGLLSRLSTCPICVNLQSQSPGQLQLGHVGVAGIGTFGSGVVTGGDVQVGGGIKAGGNGIFGGNVGIGTDNPVAQLDVAGRLPSSAVSSVTTGTNPIDIQVIGRYAYITNAGSNQLEVFDVTDPTQPNLIGSVTTDALPLHTDIQGHYAYVVAAGGQALQIIDVANPVAPVVVGSVGLGSGNPFYVDVQGRYAYIANTDGKVQIVDIAKAAAPTLISTINTGGQPIGLTVKGRYVYVVDVASKLLLVIDAANPSTASVVGSVGTGDDPFPPTIVGRYAYVPISNSITGNRVEIYDIKNPTAPVLAASVNTGTAPVRVILQGRYMFVSLLTSNTVQVFDITNPLAPSEMGSIITGGNNSGVAVVGRYAYVINIDDNLFEVFDIGGGYIQQLQTGGIESGSLHVGDLTVNNKANFQGGVTAGSGVAVQGDSSFEGNGYFGGRLGVGTTSPGSKLHIIPGATNEVGSIIQGVVGQVADFLQAQDSDGNVLANLDKDGTLTVKGLMVVGMLTVNGHIVTGGSAPTALVLPAAGVGASVSVSGNDTLGAITISTGTGSGSGDLVTITFSSPFGAAPKVVLSPASRPSSGLQYYQGAVSATDFVVGTNIAPSDGATYKYNYWVGQ